MMEMYLIFYRFMQTESDFVKSSVLLFSIILNPNRAFDCFVEKSCIINLKQIKMNCVNKIVRMQKVWLIGSWCIVVRVNANGTNAINVHEDDCGLIVIVAVVTTTEDGSAQLVEVVLKAKRWHLRQN